MKWWAQDKILLKKSQAAKILMADVDDEFN